jgi:hypothetical protein
VNWKSYPTNCPDLEPIEGSLNSRSKEYIVRTEEIEGLIWIPAQYTIGRLINYRDNENDPGVLVWKLQINSYTNVTHFCEIIPPQ